MVNIEKEACPEKKDFLWRERLSSVSHNNISRVYCSVCVQWCLHKPGLLYITFTASAGVVGDVSQ